MTAAPERVALVLGAAVWEGGVPSPTFRLRVTHAVGLWRQGEVAAICVAGGTGAHGPPEGEVGRALAVRLGVPEGAILIETVSRSTVENLALARPLLAGRAVVLVSNRWHLPRAWLAARLMGWRVETSAPAGTMTWPRTIRAAAREALALPSTVVRALRAR